MCVSFRSFVYVFIFKLFWMSLLYFGTKTLVFIGCEISNKKKSWKGTLSTL